MNKNDIKNKVKGFWKDNKRKIIYAGVVIGTVIGGVAIIKNISDEDNSEEKSNNRIQVGEICEDQGRRLLMTFSDINTEEVLWKERCTEEYMNDYKDQGMEYEEVRKLNGLE